MIRCVIIDDEQYAISVIENYIGKVPQLELVGTSTNPLAGIELIKNNQVDLVFLDIQMDEMTGIELMNLLPENVKVVFCTAFPEFAVESYNLEAVDYLLKPIPLTRFIKAVHRVTNIMFNKAVKELEEIPNDYIFIKAEQKGKMLKLNLDDIDYVEGMKNYVAFHRGKEKILSYLTMKDVEEKLPKTQFIRVHKSYIVSLKKISAVENNLLVLHNCSEKIPLSETYRESFINKMKNNLLF